MKSFARNQGTQAAATVIANDILANESSSVNEDNTGLECDAVIHLRNGKYGLVEIKLGGDDMIEAGAKTLKKLRNCIDTTKMSNPSFLMVLTGIGKYAYKREDGVLVVPIGVLKN